MSRYVTSTVVVGEHGQCVVTRPYTEIGGLRFYDDILVVGPHGECRLSRGWISAPDDKGQWAPINTGSGARHG